MKIKYLLAIFLFLSGTVQLSAQYLQAHAQEDGTIHVSPIELELPQSKNNPMPQLEGFPKAYVANQSFKNFRNVTLADLDGDGAEEIIAGVDDDLYAISSTGILWKRAVEGLSNFPPSVADVDGDGDLEIALATWSVNPRGGHLYLVDHNGGDVAGWPRNFSGNLLVNAPTIADVNGDGQQEIIIGERTPPTGLLHIFDHTGGLWNTNWPVELDATPAVTPSVGDIDDDDEKEIVIFSTQSEYVFNLDGTPEAGWPIQLNNKKHSYQSPILVDLDEDNTLEIVGAAHGDEPEFFVRDYAGNYLPNWPQAIPANSWTFSTPSVFQFDEKNTILMGKPTGTSEDEMLYAWSASGTLQNGFPIRKAGGVEGIICIADLDGDGEAELLFGSNLFDQDTGTSFLHAYEMNGEEMFEFQIRPRGWTFMNGASLGDVDGDGKMDILALSYTQNFGAATDSVYINAYPTTVPYESSRIWWGTYKGSNSREGVLGAHLPSTTKNIENIAKISLAPNPSSNKTYLTLDFATKQAISVEIVNILGQTIQLVPQQDVQQASLELDTESLEQGVYFVLVRTAGKLVATKRLLKAAF